MTTRSWQMIEGALVCLFAFMIIYLGPMGFPWWQMVLIFFAPDLFMLGYAISPRIGAFAYNIAHLYATGVGVIMIGLLPNLPIHVLTVGVLWLAHAGADRMLGYGLKEMTGFKDTHLGRIGS